MKIGEFLVLMLFLLIVFMIMYSIYTSVTAGFYYSGYYPYHSGIWFHTYHPVIIDHGYRSSGYSSRSAGGYGVK